MPLDIWEGYPEGRVHACREACSDASRRSVCLFAFDCEGRCDKDRVRLASLRRTLQTGKPGLCRPDTVMERLRAGKTLGQALSGIGSHPGFRSHCALHPQWGEEAKPLVEKNAEAARARKGSFKRNMTHCIYGHPLSGDNLLVEGRTGFRRCRACLARRAAAPRPPTEDQVKKVTAALNAGQTISRICRGVVDGKKVGKGIIGFNKLKFYRAANPDFDRFVCSVISISGSKAQQRRRDPAIFQMNIIRAQTNDYHAIAAMVPTNLPEDDVAHSVYSSCQSITSLPPKNSMALAILSRLAFRKIGSTAGFNAEI